MKKFKLKENEDNETTQNTFKLNKKKKINL